MKIRFIQIAATDRQCFMSGKEYDLPDAEARVHVRCGHAVEVLTEAEPLRASPEPARRPVTGKAK